MATQGTGDYKDYDRQVSCRMTGLIDSDLNNFNYLSLFIAALSKQFPRPHI